MFKNTKLWPIKKLREKFRHINFPEYQREPNVWGKGAKQRLIDSILRQFDIASIYLYKAEDGSLDCVDGRQRLGAIMSFLGDNPEDEDEGFKIKITNEIYPEEDPPFDQFNGLTFAEVKGLADDGDEDAKRLVETFISYEITIVKLSGSREPEEFNLQFTRLNLGTIINSGEKLHAMVGDMRGRCFGPMSENPYLESLNIPTRRFAKEQVLAQILGQIFSYEEEDEWTRTRHYDLQRFVKQKNSLTPEEEERVDRVGRIMELLADSFDDTSGLRNRAISVSTVLLAWQEGVSNREEAEEVAEFTEDFVCRLLWQVGLGFDSDDEYRYLVDEFNRYVTQASVERYSVEGRADILQREFHRWQETGMIRGDEEYEERVRSDPSEDCQD